MDLDPAYFLYNTILNFGSLFHFTTYKTRTNEHIDIELCANSIFKVLHFLPKVLNRTITFQVVDHI